MMINERSNTQIVQYIFWDEKQIFNLQEIWTKHFFLETWGLTCNKYFPNEFYNAVVINPKVYPDANLK